MTVPAGKLTLGDAAAELGLSLPISLGDPRIRGLASKSTGTISMTDLQNTVADSFTVTAGGTAPDIGFALSSKGSITPASFLSKQIKLCYEESGHLVFGLVGTTHLKETAFNAVEINGVVFDPTDASDFKYFDGGTEWRWTTGVGMVAGQTYAVKVTYGPGIVGYTATNGAFPMGQGLDWTLKFEDNFSGSSLDTSKWNDHIWYQESDATINYSIANGCLNIWPALNANNQFFMRSFDTDGKFYQTYGYFEIRAKLPIGRGCWPQFWLFNHDDANDYPEIDIMGAYSGGGYGTGWSDAALHPINYAVNVWHKNPPELIAGSKLSEALATLDLSAAFHVYGCKWTESQVSFYFDGTLIASYATTGANALTKRMYPLLTLGFGGASGTPNTTDTPRGSGNAYQIDYVRVWSAGATPGGGGGDPGGGDPGGGTPGGGTGGNPSGIYPALPGNNTNFTLTFNEDFNGSAVDTTKWNDHIWYEGSDSNINYAVGNGRLDIWPVAPFINRTLDTDGKFYQTYGFFEIEAKLPIGFGCWPAFWLFNHDDDVHPEIDILEAYSGGDTNLTPWGDNNHHPVNYAGTVWISQTTETLAGQHLLGQYMPTLDLAAAFHKYGCLWESDGVTFYFDGQQLGPKISFTSSRRMYILLDLWFGSASGTPSVGGTPQGQTNSYSVNYVRAWQIGTTPGGGTPGGGTGGTPAVHFYGASLINGTNGSSGPNPVTSPIHAIVAAQNGWTTAKDGYPGTNSNAFLNATNEPSSSEQPWPHTTDWYMANNTESVVVINFLINDWNTDDTNWLAHISSIVSKAHAANKTIVVMGSQPTYQQVWSGGTAEDNEVGRRNNVLRDWCSANSVPFIDLHAYLLQWMSANNVTRAQFTPDGLHPDQNGYNVIGQYVAQRLKQILGL